MLVVVLLAVLVAATVGVALVAIARSRRRQLRPQGEVGRPATERAWRRAASPSMRREQRRPQPFDVADQPPAGLRPLVASPRVVALEAARGIRELELWLSDDARS